MLREKKVSRSQRVPAESRLNNLPPSPGMTPEAGPPLPEAAHSDT